jgi:hypothetical protein
MKCHPTNSHVFNSPLYLLDKTFNQAFRRPLRGPLSEQLFAEPPDQPEPLRLRSTALVGDRIGKDRTRTPSASYPAYLDVFARKQRAGWTVWGNGVASQAA